MNLRPSREPLLCSMLAMFLSGLVYAMAQGIGGSNGLWTVLISRIFLGFVRGNEKIAAFVCLSFHGLTSNVILKTSAWKISAVTGVIG